MKRRNKKPYFESWYFREQAAAFTCDFTVRIDYDEKGKLKGGLDIELPCGKWHLDYAHPVNMSLRDSLFVVLGKNVFTEACIHLDVDEPGVSIKGDIYFDEEWGKRRISWKRKIWAMEQELSGGISVNGKVVSFDGGKGYLEETRDTVSEGTKGHFWSQCNWFGEKPFRIVCGGCGRHCFAIIDQNGYPIRMAWWKGAKLEYMCGSGFRMSQGRYVLEGWCSEGDADAINQSVRYRLTHGAHVLFDEISKRAVYRY